MAEVFNCGGFYLLKTLLNGIITEFENHPGCMGIRYIAQTWANCTPIDCGSTQTYEHLLRRAIVTDSNGMPSLNIVILTDADVANCGIADQSLEKKFAKCFCETSEGETALIILTRTDSPR